MFGYPYQRVLGPLSRVPKMPSLTVNSTTSYPQLFNSLGSEAEALSFWFLAKMCFCVRTTDTFAHNRSKLKTNVVVVVVVVVGPSQKLFATNERGGGEERGQGRWRVDLSCGGFRRFEKPPRRSVGNISTTTTMPCPLAPPLCVQLCVRVCVK